MPAYLEPPQRPGSLLRNGALPLVIGHRGASADAPENTLAAFRRCWDAGVNWVETDVQPTGDLVPVLFHDDDLDRTTDGTGPLRSTGIVELSALDAGGWFDPSFAGEPVPTLHATLSALPPEGRVMLEIKGPHAPADLIAELAVIRATGSSGRVWPISFEIEVLRELRTAIPTGWFGVNREEPDDDPVAVCRELSAASYHPDHRIVLDRPGIVQTLHAAGISVVVWTADDPDSWSALPAAGVDGIITNTPAALRQWQRRR
jgi:glycerophosphoryl diester phosphodiesterase